MTRRLQVLFLLALLGVAVVLGLAALALGGPVALGGYGGVVLVLLALGVRRGRALTAPARRPGRTCDCCTGTVHDPVRVI